MWAKFWVSVTTAPCSVVQFCSVKRFQLTGVDYIYGRSVLRSQIYNALRVHPKYKSITLPVVEVLQKKTAVFFGVPPATAQSSSKQNDTINALRFKLWQPPHTDVTEPRTHQKKTPYRYCFTPLQLKRSRVVLILFEVEMGGGEGGGLLRLKQDELNFALTKCHLLHL